MLFSSPILILTEFDPGVQHLLPQQPQACRPNDWALRTNRLSQAPMDLLPSPNYKLAMQKLEKKFTKL